MARGEKASNKIEEIRKQTNLHRRFPVLESRQTTRATEIPSRCPSEIRRSTAIRLR